MEINISQENGMLVVTLIGELDEHSAEFVRNAVDSRLVDADYTALVFDLSRLCFMDSTGIGVIIGRYKLAHRRGKAVYVRAPGVTVDKIFKMSGLYEIISKIA